MVRLNASDAGWDLRDITSAAPAIRGNLLELLAMHLEVPWGVDMRAGVRSHRDAAGVRAVAGARLAVGANLDTGITWPDAEIVGDWECDIERGHGRGISGVGGECHCV